MEKTLGSGSVVLPALTLTYGFIDKHGYLAAGRNRKRVRPRFERWVSD